jgi:methylenetetrahydrofolate dehydrogenase (NADP+) / methenyltetrahydrofolate cyclohydrolase
MILDGRALARDILTRTKERAERLGRRPLVVALVSGETPATKSYLKIKSLRAADAGCDFEVRPYPATYDTAGAVIIQLPMDDGVDSKAACDALPVEKDADVLSAHARAMFEKGSAGALLPPVVGAVKKVLEFGHVEVAGKRAVVVGSGFLVGAPVAMWLTQQGAQVTVVDKEVGDLFEALSTADIIVSGAGVPNLITPDVLKQGVVLIDAGTAESGGVIVGDADPACAQMCSLFTPVPGGIGPIAVACLFENVVALCENN